MKSYKSLLYVCALLFIVQDSGIASPGDALDELRTKTAYYQRLYGNPTVLQARLDALPKVRTETQSSSIPPEWLQVETLSESGLVDAIMAAEGTCTEREHTDPGYGKRQNFGVFSSQHSDKFTIGTKYQDRVAIILAEGSSEEIEALAKLADKYEAGKLSHHQERLLKQAEEHGITLSLLAQVSFLDLANQAPGTTFGDRGNIGAVVRLARFKKEGVPDWMKELYLGNRIQKGELNEYDMILLARIWAYYIPLKGWDAHGLGEGDLNNTYIAVEVDQQRRMRAILRALMFSPNSRNAENDLFKKAVPGNLCRQSHPAFHPTPEVLITKR